MANCFDYGKMWKPVHCQFGDAVSSLKLKDESGASVSGFVFEKCSWSWRGFLPGSTKLPRINLLVSVSVANYRYLPLKLPVGEQRVCVFDYLQ